MGGRHPLTLFVNLRNGSLGVVPIFDCLNLLDSEEGFCLGQRFRYIYQRRRKNLFCLFLKLLLVLQLQKINPIFFPFYLVFTETAHRPI